MTTGPRDFRSAFSNGHQHARCRCIQGSVGVIRLQHLHGIGPAHDRDIGRPVRIEPVSKSRPPKTGIFWVRAGDFREFSLEKFESLPRRDAAKSKKPSVGGPFNCLGRIFSDYRTGWLATQWDSNRSPGVFPANREFYREICNPTAQKDDFEVRNRCAAGTFQTIPYTN